MTDEDAFHCSSTLIVQTDLTLENTQHLKVRWPSQPTAAVGTDTVPFSLEKTLEVLQCTSHLDLLGRGERGQVNDGMANRNTYM